MSGMVDSETRFHRTSAHTAQPPSKPRQIAANAALATPAHLGYHDGMARPAVDREQWARRMQKRIDRLRDPDQPPPNPRQLAQVLADVLEELAEFEPDDPPANV